MKLNPLQQKISYATLIILWLLIAFNYIFPFSITGLQQALYWTGIVMAAVHMAEVFIFYKKLKPETSKAVGVVMLFLFGIAYASSLDEIAK